MWQTLDIDIVAPPFAGHLYPLLDLASGLQARGMTGLHVLSTADAAPAIAAAGLRGDVLLPGREDEVQAIANPGYRVGSNPFRLARQFRQNLRLMVDLQQQLRERWQRRRPDLVLADFTVPIAGLTAQALGLPWWTGTTSPCAIETRFGTPSYLGGWSPPRGWPGRWRDRGGRAVIRVFKRTLARFFAPELQDLGVQGAYRANGMELVYSPEKILAYGVPEFEFERDWPSALRFIGPLTGGPTFPHGAPQFEVNRRHILVSLGTHVLWAKQAAFALVERAAQAVPDCIFHITHGVPASQAASGAGNVRYHGYVPYDRYLPRYDAALVHGGTGLVYSCLKAGVPMLVWPQDFDHYDHAARIVAHGLGLRFRRRTLARDLERLLTDAALRRRVAAFQELLRRYNAHELVLAELREFADRKTT